MQKPFEPWQLHLEIAAAPRSGELVVRLEGGVVRRGGFTLGPVDLEINWGDRLGVLGRNGAGKTTLLSTILGKVELEQGTRRVGPAVSFGELGQARRHFSSSETLMSGFLKETSMRTSEARSLLAKFGLGAEEIERGFATLSPGERTRAELALLMAKGTNCLVLDEPTNHLDLPAIEQLEVALSSWRGTLLLVTHDRRLLDSVMLTATVEMADDGGPVRGITRRSNLRA